MSKCCFEDTLHYSSPAHGDQGIVRVGMLVPESHQLFVCPFACGRHGAIGAMQHGIKERLSYLYIDQSDIISGYDNAIIEAVDELLEILNPQPRVLMIFVSCLDDLIGTDHEAILEELSQKYEHIHFRVGHMNPISLDSDSPPPITVRRDIYSLLEPRQEKDQGINTVGVFNPLSANSEIRSILSSQGFGEIRHIAEYDKFDDYQDMAKSCLNLVLGPAALRASQEMEERLGIPYIFLPVSYRKQTIREQYKIICGKLNINFESIDFSQYEKRADEAIQSALKAVGHYPILIDASACVKPFEMARCLTEYGFKVARVAAQKCINPDKENLDWILENAPDIEIIQPQHHNTVKFDKRIKESISIGVDGAYISDSQYVVDLFNDEGMFGYDGLIQFMNLLGRSMDKKADLEKIIKGYGLVV